MYLAPRDHVEEHVSRLTAELLGKSGIGVTDNLFDHGMDSLQVAELRLLLRKQFGAMPSLDDVYRLRDRRIPKRGAFGCGGG